MLFTQEFRTRFMWGILVTLTVMLSACMIGSDELGISKDQWSGMSDTDRAQLLKDHQQVEMIRNKPRIIYQSPPIEISLNQGSVRMPPFAKGVFFAYRPLSWRLEAGKCRTITLYARQGSHMVDLRSCYDGQSFYLDASETDSKKALGSLRFVRTPFWKKKKGMTYRDLSSTGYASLREFDITIKMLFSS